MDAWLMSVVEVVIILLCLVYAASVWLFPFILSKVIQYKYNCSITIGRIGLNLALHDVTLKADDLSVLIGKIGFASSLFNGEAPKLLSVIITTVNIVRYPKSSGLEPSLSPRSNVASTRRKLRAPAIVSNLVQFLGIHIAEVHLWGWEPIDEKKGVHMNIVANNISVDGCTTVGGTNICACIVVILERVSARISENWLPNSDDLSSPSGSSYFHGRSGLTLLEWDFDFRLNLIFSPRNSGDFIEHFSIDVGKLLILWELKERSIKLLKMLQKTQSARGDSAEDPTNKISTFFQKIEDIVFTQCVPKELKFRIYETECRISDSNTKMNFESRVSGLSFASRCHISSVNDNDTVTFESQFDLGLIRIEPDRYQGLSVDQFSNYINFTNQSLTVDLDISNFCLKSHEKYLQFAKTKLKSNAVLKHTSHSSSMDIQEVFQSLLLKFEGSELECQWNEKSGSLTSAFLEAECKDVSEMWNEDVCSMEMILKNFNTTLLGQDFCRPVSFDLLGFHLKREQVGAKLEGSRVFWNPKIEASLCSILPVDRSPSKKKIKTKYPYIKGVNVEVFDCKAVYVSEKNLFLNADIGTLFTTSDNETRTVSIEKFEVYSSSSYSDCTLNPLFTIPKCEYQAVMNEKADAYHDICMRADTKLYWSPLIHLQVTEFYSKLKSARSWYSPPVSQDAPADDATSTIPSPTTPKEPVDSAPAAPKSTMCFRFNKSFAIIAKLAKNHSVEISADDWSVENGKNHIDWNFRVLRVKFDNVHVMQWKNVVITKSPEFLELTKAYRKSANLSKKKNLSWRVEIEKVNFTFPYGFNFAAAFQEEFITCTRWIRKLNAKPNTTTPTLWSDLSIKLRDVRIEVGDDPFEVKLRDNYELLEDEYFESVKRLQVLETKINQLYKTNLLMSSSKIDELRTQLKERSSNIYIQRSKKLYESHPMRSHLLLWELHDVHIVALADPTMFGKEKITEILQELDPDSPWPAESLDFNTLWCRAVRFDVAKWRVQLRDFPQPLMDSRQIHFWGKLAAGEVIATKRSKRTCEIEIGGPYGVDSIERSLTSLKWYYDLNCDIESLSVAFGPCWEPVIAQCNLSFDNIFPPSKDPSKPLPFWDKIRLMLHGRLYIAVNTLTQLLHASLNPYNTTEEMEVTWTAAAIAWTNGKIIFEGDLNIYVRTASKYDDCRMLQLPSVRLTFKLNWICYGDANDHHSITPCAPDKLPEYSSNQEHDSYRAFRSQNLNLNINLETRSGRAAAQSVPTAVLYGSTLRWFENLKLILSGTTRPTRRGRLFKTTRPRKIPISRHYKKIRLSVSLNRIHVCYWVSCSMQSGIELFSGKLSSSSEHMLQLTPNNDGLIHRPKADWSVVYVNSELNETEIWLQASLQQDASSEMNFRKPIEKFFFMSIDKLSYGREALLGSTECQDNKKSDNPQHRLVVHELKGAWTSSNRDVAFALLDSFVKTQQLKKNLSTEALKSFLSKHDVPTGSPIKNKNGEGKKGSRSADIASPTSAPQPQRPPVGASPLSSIQGQNATASLLQKLISEAESRGVVFSEDMTAPPPQQSLHGVAQSSLDDVIHHKWLIELVNCQVLLKGTETSGYVILSSAKAHILQREHKPVWKHGTIVPKTTWVGALEGMQYYATVSAGSLESPEENIQWLSVENIEERDTTAISNIPDMVGSGQSVGGVVSETVGALSDESTESVQLQRIVSRCKCEFFYTTFGETGVDKIPSGIPDIPPAPRDVELWDEISKPVEAFTLMHYDLNVFTNSLQYAMIMDIVNNLVLYVDPKRKERFEKLQRLRFKLQLQSTEAQRGPIQQLQNHLRTLVNQLRRLEKESYLISKQIQEDPNNEALNQQVVSLDQQVNECKEQVAAKGEELHMMIMCFKETKLASSQRLSRKRDNKDVYLVRVYEICFKHAQWRLTQTDGQLGIADLVLSNFLYTKADKSDDSVEHLCELGYITVTNLLPNQIYKEVLVPSHIHASMPVDRQRTLRVFCRDRPPVGGIAVKEHFEINIAPITIGMTYQFFKTLFKFCFPEKDPEKLDELDLQAGGDNSDTISVSSERTGGNGSHNMSDTASTLSGPTLSVSSLPHKGKKARIKRKESKFYVAMNNEKDDVEKMKERAERNMLFICVKIPEVPVRVSYKGEKDKNIEDVHDVHVIIPTLEYNNITWTWLDFLIAVRNHSKRVLLSQALKQKLLWSKAIFSDSNAVQEEDKAKMLLGLPGDTKSLMKSLFGPHKK
ncbi:unnamed protein product [Orchesella dallaii]|uniref:FMP27/BLTP2/Hobbit GFWDK motif-containing RBG unit domain-containing protein n=1 Tax=Orchesella dallaii TaxID=48710 RepID=A0ABP1QZX9_9HEXA